jgi:hypothetical protein
MTHDGILRGESVITPPVEARGQFCNQPIFP